MKINKEGELFIIEEETGGRAYYEDVYENTFIWPGGFSGCTAMVGVDIGYYSEQDISLMFKSIVSADELALIQKGRGLTGLKAKEYLPNLKKIILTWEEAISVFKSVTLPKFCGLTARVFPGADDLCEDAQAALLSLVFNRGTSVRGESRKEMAEIKKLVPSKDYEGIAKQIKSMKRLWAKGSGLLGRRDREAALVLKCTS
jgi:hypothetical protein